MKISIRVKFFVVLLAFSLGPIFVSRGLMSRASNNVIKETGDQTRRELLGIVSDEFRYTASSLLDLLERGSEVMRLATLGVARVVDGVLALPSPEDGPEPFLANDFGDPDLTPPDAARRQGYSRRTMGNRQQLIQVSFDHPTFHLPHMLDERAVEPEMHRLLLAMPEIRAIFRNLPQAPFWINVAMESGVMMTYPGHGRLPAMYDARTQDWYVKVREANAFQWFHSVDPATRYVVNKVVYPLRDASGRFLGAVSIDIPTHSMMADEQLEARWGGEVRTFLVERIPEGSPTEKGLPILVQREPNEQGRHHWMSAVEQEWLTFDEPVGYEVLLHAMDTRDSGVVDVSYEGEPSLCAFASTEVVSLLVIAPKTVAAKLPDEVAASLQSLFAEVRAMSSVVSGAMLIITGLIAWFGSRAITKPIYAIVEVARKLTRGDFGARIEHHTGDERDDLINSINEMGPQLKELMHLNRVMEVAQEVQRLLLPGAEPELAGYDISGGILYCDKTGGDYYDFLKVCPADHAPCLAVVIGDVSGHGVPSALVMATARGQLHTLSDIEMAPHERVGTINRVLSRDLDGTGRFLTLFYLQLTADSNQVQWVRAGHDPAIRYNPATDVFGELHGEGIPLGVIENYAYATSGTTLEGGEVLVMATDGVWEARNADGEMFGKQRMLAIIRESAHKSAEGIRLAMMAAVEAFQGNGQEDDIAVVVVKREADGKSMARHSISFRMTNKQNCFKCFQPKVEAFGIEHGLHPKIIFHLTLVLDELITNIISYGYADFDEHPIDATIVLQGEDLIIRVEDDSEPFNILEAPEPELDVPLEDRTKPVGGLGIHLIKNMVHGIHYKRENGKNVLTLHKNIGKTHCPVQG
ncbi:protein serine/threonine phosphatase with extracellular sensor [Pseudodesulfovibrio mercurii]|uniref:Protein serine/threonine phosphatase with extracellular sensor n=1 Tax=Pseudodesulfovibrio mercurii TaxID=641491 RepID=F0JIS6_9BACT|nr:SpoIIE family protein phosphatase [Pseudodesulfovibrio mercurii]EGB15825.1 protein serine/threonine phosphatase with extracellular sensor [Pseudodesulfovibrio mercurii]